MSRGEGDYDDYDAVTPYEFWTHNVDQVLNSRRGRKDLALLKDALLALPERRLISRALCTVGALDRPKAKTSWGAWRDDAVADLVAEQGEGVCAVGAYIWYKMVKAGIDETAAFDRMPMGADFDDYTLNATAHDGRNAGLRFTLAYILAELNDQELKACTPEERWTKVLEWIEERLTTT